jgi:hypothetical protein
MKSVPRLSFISRTVIAAFALCLSCRYANALSVRIAPLALLDSLAAGRSDAQRPDRLLLEELEATSLAGAVEFLCADAALPPPATFLEAARVCEGLGYPYLLYGYVKGEGSLYYSEIKLVAREGKRIAATFVATDDGAHYGRMIGDLARKIADYFLVDLAIVSGAGQEAPARNVFEIPVAAGCWAPIGDWAAGAMGLACVDAGFRFIPRNPLAALSSKPLFLGAGLRVEYSLGKNRPEYENSYLHKIGIRLPVEVFLGLGRGGRIGASLGGIFEFDILAQERKYGDPFVRTTSAGGMSASLLYRYSLSDRLDFGLELQLEALFYSQPLYAIAPRAVLTYSLAKSTTAK